MTNAARMAWVLCAVLLATAGCSRTHYRLRSDRDSYGILEEKTHGKPWEPPPDFSIYPHPASRFFDPTPLDDPLLPIPAPNLYAHQLPEIPKRDPARFRPDSTSDGSQGAKGSEDAKGVKDAKDVKDSEGKPPCKPEVLPEPGQIHELPELLKQSPTADNKNAVDSGITLVGHQEPAQPGIVDDPDQAEEPPPSTGPDLGGALRIVPIPKDAWEALPTGCLQRMLEFETVRDEYERTYGKQPGDEMRDSSQRLALEDIVKLGLINSRSYQTQKETLYTAALLLTFERYQYQLKFSPFGNGTDLEYIHNREGGVTVNTLGINTQFAVERILASGGNLLARFANDVLLTFNGPDGFAVDVGSEILVSFSQTVFQRDLVFEPLTQAERDVVYAARDFARFRKVFFQDLAFQYYTLLNTYRNIQIASQDYFRNLRAFAQQSAYFRNPRGTRRTTRIQVDQVEQNVLQSRSNLIATCNTLESRLDALKFAMGIPPEMPINLDLTELEELTLRDETIVAAEFIRRGRRNLQQERDKQTPDRAVLLTQANELTRRVLALIAFRNRLEEEDMETSAYEEELALGLVYEAELAVDFDRRELAEVKQARPPVAPVFVFERTEALLESLDALIQAQLNLARQREVDPARVAEFRRRAADIIRRLEQIRVNVTEAFKRRSLDPWRTHLIAQSVGAQALAPGMTPLGALAQALIASRIAELEPFPPQLDRIPPLVESAEALIGEADLLVSTLADLLNLPRLTPEEQMRQTLERVDRLLSESGRIESGVTVGLVPIDIGVDDAMMTALVSRFDLMNQRGVLADVWRRIKLAGDDLRSILNLNATQIVRTDSDHNRPFDFTFEDSQTRLGLSLDAPLNRRAQRNAFRRSLINYQAALRNLIELEDTIKVNVRNDLRNLQLDNTQYRIAVSSAALASERVTSTSLSLALGRANVSARDFLEAQQAYTRSLSQVANEHISYIQDRISLFLDLEALHVDNEGFWPTLYDEKYSPIVQFAMPPIPPYGTLPPNVWYSHKVKRMLKIPPGEPTIYHPISFFSDEHDAAGDEDANGDDKKADDKKADDMMGEPKAEPE